MDEAAKSPPPPSKQTQREANTAHRSSSPPSKNAPANPAIGIRRESPGGSFVEFASRTESSIPNDAPAGAPKQIL